MLYHLCLDWIRTNHRIRWRNPASCCVLWGSVQFISVAQSCPTLCNPMNRSTPGLPVYHQLLEFTETHIHRVGDAIQQSQPLLSPSPPAPQSLPASESFPVSQLLAWGGQSTGVSVLWSGSSYMTLLLHWMNGCVWIQYVGTYHWSVCI